MTTAHKAKGLEWPRVCLANDFLPKEKLQDLMRTLTGTQMELPIKYKTDDEYNLFYVAMTRACTSLIPNK